MCVWGGHTPSVPALGGTSRAAAWTSDLRPRTGENGCAEAPLVPMPTHWAQEGPRGAAPRQSTEEWLSYLKVASLCRPGPDFGLVPTEETPLPASSRIKQRRRPGERRAVRLAGRNRTWPSPIVISQSSDSGPSADAVQTPVRGPAARAAGWEGLSTP